MALLPKDPTERKYIIMGLRIAGDFGATIAAPLVIFVLIGQKLDEKYASYPRYLILAFVFAATLSCISIYKKAKKYGKEYKEIDEANLNNNKKDSDN